MNITQMYDSDDFVVVQIDANSVPPEQETDDRLTRIGFEIVHKKLEKFVYLDGVFAEGFIRHIKAWQAKTPQQRDVEKVLEGYSLLMQLPLVIH